MEHNQGKLKQVFSEQNQNRRTEKTNQEKLCQGWINRNAVNSKPKQNINVTVSEFSQM